MSFPGSVNSSSVPFQYSQLDLGFASRRDYGRPVDYPGRGAIGQPVQFTMGQFTGQIIRAQLTEIQKAELGRKHVHLSLVATPSLNSGHRSWSQIRQCRQEKRRPTANRHAANIPRHKSWNVSGI